MRRLVPLDDTLCRMIEANQPSGSGRWGGFATDEKLVTDWTKAVGRLLADGDALMPGDSYKIGRDGTNGGPSSSPDRGGARPPRQRAQDAATPRRPARRKRAGGKRVVTSSARASLAREREPVTGKWGSNEKAAEPSPPRSE